MYDYFLQIWIDKRPSEKNISPSRSGGVAQLGERLNGIQEVRGSIPLISTIPHQILTLYQSMTALEYQRLATAHV